MVHSTLVAVCTYQRPDDLVALLDSLVPALSGQPVELVVVDNDPNGSAQRIVADHPIGARYELCDTPGIAQARNAALALRGDHSYVSFVDDDETVHPDWFSELMAGLERYEADVATGPVVSLFPPTTPAWVLRGGFIQRERFPSGTVLPLAATNNFLVRATALEKLADPWFDGDFSRSGGSDAELTWRLVRNGAKIVWVDTAVVEELVPVDRTTLRWITRRLVRGGNGHGRLMMRDGVSRGRVLLSGLRLVCVGALSIGRALVTRRGLQAFGYGTFAHGVGRIQSACGEVVYEYARG